MENIPITEENTEKKKRMSVSIIGGDTRQIHLAKAFENGGYDVIMWGFDNLPEAEGFICVEDIKDAVRSSNICVFPLPLSRDNVWLNAPQSKREIKISEILDILQSQMTVYAGKPTEAFVLACKEKNIRLVDYFSDECLCIKNAQLTAEATVDILINNLEIPLSKAKIMVVGYGRIGKLVAEMLMRMNASVTVAARSREQLAYAECFGANPLRMNKNAPKDALVRLNDGYDAVINTVPAMMFDRGVLEKLKNNIFVVDLASPPGGVDIRFAKECGLKVVWALSLPGKYSPRRAGEIIAETILEDIKERGEDTL